MNSNKKICLVGYGGHSYVACDIFITNKMHVKYYVDLSKKIHNPYSLEYLGGDQNINSVNISICSFFPSIGDNHIRGKSFKYLHGINANIINAFHPKSVISINSTLGIGIMVGAYSVINPFSFIGNGVICNTSCIIEHEVRIDNYAHIGPGAILCGNVTVGEYSFVGAGAVVKQGVNIASNVIIGAGSVVINDVSEGMTYAGVPARPIK